MQRFFIYFFSLVNYSATEVFLVCVCGSELTLFDPEIERIVRAIRRVVREASLAQRILVEDNPLISSDPEEEITMAVVPPPTMGNHCKRTDK